MSALPPASRPGGGGLPPAVRRRIEEFVRPLYAGLDGEQTFDRVDRAERRALALAGAEPLDRGLLELLCLFHGAIERLGSLGPQGRLALFLRSLDLPAPLARGVRAGLGRFRRTPASREEELLHDAALLEQIGARAAVEQLLAAGRRRATLDRALSGLDPGPAAERFRTAAGAAEARRRRARTEAWIAELRRLVAEEQV